MFTISATMKFAQAKSMIEHWKEYRYPLWLMFVIATLELLGVVGLVIAIWVPALLKVSALLLAVLMIGAIHAHLFRAKHKPIMAINALFMLILSSILVYDQCTSW
ncbi:DoxX family protein [Paenibacillus sp. GSMTC-2017]|nr:DoxX family protein [Paenibacillus sp. GSMTC-2017]